MNRKVLGAVFAVAGLGFGSSAHANLVSLFNNAPANTLLSDNSAEAWIDVDLDGTVSVDDILFGILSIGDIQGTQIGGITTYNELTIIQANRISALNATVMNSQGVLMGIYDAEAVGPGDTAYFDWATGSILGVVYTFNTAFGATNDDKTLAIVFEDSANNATRETDIQTGLSVHTDGDERLLVTLDTSVDPTDTINVIAPVNPLAAIGIVGTANTSYALSSFFLDGTIAQQDWPGLYFFQDITAGTGGFATPSTTSSWPIFDNIDFTVTAARVPEPGSLALLSIGLLGIGGVACRRSTKRA
jgi:hypothetical protein